MSRKKREGIVYSTNPDFQYEREQVKKAMLPPAQQLLYVWIDSKSRNGKTVTLIRGFEGVADDLEKLAREIKTGCGTGGAVKNGEIIIQGEFRDKIIRLLNEKGYKTKKAGG